MDRSFLLAGLVGLSLTACGGGSLSQAGATVTLNMSDPPAGCVEAGGVSSYTVGPDY